MYYPLDGEVEPLTGLPESNVLQFYTNSIKVSARPSGTEPKIKFYFGVKEKLDDVTKYEQLRAVLENKIEKIVEDLKL